MPEKRRWQDVEGLETVQTIVRKCLPQWDTGLRPVQLELVSAIPDGDDVLCCAATGDGKSCAFSVPPIILREYNEHPGLYVAGLPTRKRPIAVVITPTKGLAENLVHELSLLGVSAFSYCSETLTEAHTIFPRCCHGFRDKPRHRCSHVIVLFPFVWFPCLPLVEAEKWFPDSLRVRIAARA
ncbi:hypothetical protein CPC08DRAFT_717864 [Agrocybe pediades]|nr:hypothetical protein CPC08DRAFT_717864 [Agrocybe pediades]